VPKQPIHRASLAEKTAECEAVIQRDAGAEIIRVDELGPNHQGQPNRATSGDRPLDHDPVALRQGRPPGRIGGDIGQQPGYAGTLDLLDHLLEQRHALTQLLTPPSGRWRRPRSLRKTHDPSGMRRHTRRPQRRYWDGIALQK
jgi:hypothetical protein